MQSTSWPVPIQAKYCRVTGFQTGRSKCNEKKYQLTGQPIYVGETYNHNGDLYRVESFDEGYTEPKVTLRRIKDGTIFDVEAPACS